MTRLSSAVSNSVASIVTGHEVVERVDMQGDRLAKAALENLGD